MSKILSTKNDELLILIYEYQDSTTLSAPLFKKAFTVRAIGKSHTFFFDRVELIKGKNLLFLMIEQDFDRPIEQIDPVVRVQYKALLNAFKNRDYQKIKRFLGNEDLLGFRLIKAFQSGEPTHFKIEGVHKLDFYDYNVEISQK